MENQKSSKLFYKDFTLVVIGQIISLFGNNILRFALPLYLYNQTGSASLLGIVGAVSFIPAILLSPVGGIVADRVNKRNVMVVLDFATSVLMVVFMLLLGQVSLVPLIVATTMLLYGIQGAYTPAVQASIPAMMAEELLVPANAVINLVNSLAGLIGPVVGGLLYSGWGLTPVLYISIVCFFLSAVMEIFIRIPFRRQKAEAGVWQVVKGDLSQSVHFIFQRPIIVKATMLVAAFNMFLSCLIIVGTPVLVTSVLGFGQELGNQLYGYTQGAFATGGLLGGILVGTVAKRIRYENMYLLLLGPSLALVPMALSLMMGLPSMVSYVVITVCGFGIMVLASMFTIQMLSFLQLLIPEEFVGKILSVVMAICMCAQPLGQAMYGFLFDWLYTAPYTVLLLGAAVSVVVALLSRRTFSRVDGLLVEEKEKQAKGKNAVRV